MENFRIKLQILFLFLFSIPLLGQASFYLSSYKIYSSGENITFNLSTYNIEGKILFKAYLIENPVDFFEKQKNIHEPDILGHKKKNSFEYIEESLQKIISDFRFASRRYINSDTRGNIRDVLDLSRSKPRKKTENKYKDKQPDNKLIKEWDIEIRKNTEGYFSNYLDVDFPINTPGVYLIEARYKNLVGYTCLIVSDNVLITKRIDDKLFIFAVDRKTGRAVDNLELNLYVNENKLQTKKIKNGVCEFTIPKNDLKKKVLDEWSEIEDERMSENYFIMGGGTNDFAIYDISSGYYYYGDYANDKIISYFYTDRPIYRPGQEVFFKGFVFEKDEKFQPRNKEGAWVYMNVSDQNDELVKKDSFRTNKMGSYNGRFTIPTNKSLGFYNVNLTVNGESFYYSFEVQEYKKPEFKVEVKFDKNRYSNGETITGTIKANYFFGAPVKNANAEIYIMRSKFYKYYNDDEIGYPLDDEYYNPYSYNIINVYSETLNEKGETSFSFIPEVDENSDYQYIVKANVVDNSRRIISGSKKVLVTRGDYYIKSSPDKYVYNLNDEVKIKTEVYNFDNRPISLNYTLQIQRIYWVRVEKNEYGQIKYYSEEKTQEISTLKGTTSREGLSYLTIKPKEEGFYKYYVTIKDNNGNLIKDDFSFYVSSSVSGASWYTDEFIKIIPAKNNFEIGEDINFMIISPISNIDLLITCEGEDIYEYKVEHLDTKSKIIGFKAKQEFVPNFYISVSGFYAQSEISGSRRIKVLPKDKYLDINITFDKKEYKPQEKGVITVEVKDKDGNPVQGAEISCGLVDEAIYSLKEEATEDIKSSVYENKWNRVITNSSTYFYFNGRSTWIDREEQSELLTPFKKKLLSNKLEDRKNIFRGDVKGTKLVVENVRRDFRDLALWKPIEITDRQGIAKIEMKFPDNLTTWRATVRAVGRNAEVGSNISRVICRKDLMVTMETPRFFVEGDKAIITLQVHNQSEKDEIVNVSLKGEGILIEGGTISLSVPKYSSLAYDWLVNSSKAGIAKLRAEARSMNDYDIMELSIPIIEAGIRNTLSESFNLSSNNKSIDKTITLPEYIKTESVKLKLLITPSLASAFLTSLDELIGYPYGCVEQTMSRFLPTVIVSSVLDRLNIPFDEKKKAEIPKMISKGLERIKSMINSEGAWGWWEKDASNPYMTAYVVYGLKTAEKNNINIDRSLLVSGCNYLNKAINDQKLDVQTRAYILYVLSNTNYYDVKTQKDFLFRIINEILQKQREPLTLGLIANALYNFGYKQESGEITNELISRADEVQGLMFWSMKENDYTFRTDEIEIAGYAVEAMVKNNVNSEKIQNVINYLLNSRVGRGWASTKQTANIIYSLSNYLEKSKELDANYTLDIDLNQTFNKKVNITKDNLYRDAVEVLIDKSHIKGNNINLKMKLNGKGRAYVNFVVDYFDKRPDYLAQDRGIELVKEYYKLVRTGKSGEIVYVKQPIGNKLKSGDLIFVKVKMKSKLKLQYLMIEDPIFAGGEVLNDRDFLIENENYFANSRWEYRWGYFNKELRDQKVTFFVSNFDRSETQEFYYIIRAQIPGKYSVLPTVSQLMYYPQIRGTTKDEKFEIN